MDTSFWFVIFSVDGRMVRESSTNSVLNWLTYRHLISWPEASDGSSKRNDMAGIHRISTVFMSSGAFLCKTWCPFLPPFQTRCLLRHVLWLFWRWRVRFLSLFLSC